MRKRTSIRPFRSCTNKQAYRDLVSTFIHHYGKSFRRQVQGVVNGKRQYRSKQVPFDVNALNRLHEAIIQRYDLFRHAGTTSSDALTNWLAAERELVVDPGGSSCARRTAAK